MSKTLEHDTDRSNDPSQTVGKDIVVVVRGDCKLDAEVVKIACSIARPKQSRIFALYGIEVPRRQSIDAKMPTEEAAAEDALRFASTIAERCDYDIEPEIVQSRNFAHSVVEEVAQRHCCLLVMGSPYQEKHPSAAYPLEELISYVLEHALCRVWLIRGGKEIHDAPK